MASDWFRVIARLADALVTVLVPMSVYEVKRSGTFGTSVGKRETTRGDVSSWREMPGIAVLRSAVAAIPLASLTLRIVMLDW